MIIQSGASTEKSIALRNGNLSSEAKYSDDGKIQLITTFIAEDDKNCANSLSDVKLVAIVIAIINILIYAYECNYYFLLIPIVYMIFLQIIYIYKVILDDKVKKNHASEHMVIKAVEFKKARVSIEDIKKESMLSPHCGMSILPIYFIYNIIIIYISIKYKIVVPQIIIYSLFKTTFKWIPFRYIGYIFQRMSLKKPDEKSLVLAKAAADNLFDFRDKIASIKMNNSEYKVIDSKTIFLEKLNIEEEYFSELINKTNEIYNLYKQEEKRKNNS